MDFWTRNWVVVRTKNDPTEWHTAAIIALILPVALWCISIGTFLIEGIFNILLLRCMVASVITSAVWWKAFVREEVTPVTPSAPPSESGT